MNERSDTHAEPEAMDIAAWPVIAAVGAVVTVVGLAALVFRMLYGAGIAEAPSVPQPFPAPQLTTMPSAQEPQRRLPPAAIERAMDAIAARGRAAFEPLTEAEP